MGRFAVFRWLRSHRAQGLRAVLFLFLWLTLLDFPREVAATSLDSSWVRCLGHFLSHRLQCGVDYVWTYGPLGYFVHNVYDADLFWWKYTWEMAVKLAFTWILLRWAGLLRGKWIRAAFVLLVLLFLAGMVVEDTLYLFCLILLGLLPLRDESCRRPGRLAAAMVLLAVLSLTKFTFLLVGTAVWAVIVLAPGLGWRCRVAWAAGYPLAWASGWLLLGQPLGNVPRFFAASWEITRGYDEAMALAGAPFRVYAGLTALVLFLVLLASYPVSQLRRRQSLLGLALLSVSMFLVWKHGFVRQDSHADHFFGYLLFVSFAVEGLLGEAKPPSRLQAGLMTALVVIGVFGRPSFPRPTDWLNRLRFNGFAVVVPARLQRGLDRLEQRLAGKWALPAIQRIVGDQPVDLISCSQGLLFLNRLNYHPRPVFQSYSAYTPNLLERNAAFYRSERAPPFVLCHLIVLDGHFPTMEDGPALLELFRRYRPVAREKGFLLLKRLTDAGPTQPGEYPVLLQRSIAFEEEIRLDQLGAVRKLLSVRIEAALPGRLRKALFRPPPLFLKLRTQNGETYSYRLIPGMVGSDFLLDPLFPNREAMEALYAGQPLPRVRSFSIHVDPEARMFFQKDLEITVRSAEELAAMVPTRN